MKLIAAFVLFVFGFIALCLTGCGVPKTHMHAKIGNTDFDWTCPKQFSATNLVAEVQTNGTARLLVGGIQSVNDPVVIDKSAAGDVARINAVRSLMNDVFQNGASLAK